MPFYNPLWAKKQSATTGYLTLGMYPITVNITGSQTEVGSSTNTVEVSYASHAKEYWETDRTIPAYTYFTLGSTVINENNVTPVADPEIPDLPYNPSGNIGNFQTVTLHLSVASWDGHQQYNGNALTAPGTITDYVATGGGSNLYSAVLNADTVYYTGNAPCVIHYEYDENLGTLTVSSSGIPAEITAKATVTPGSIRVGGSSFWATLYGYGNVDDADDESSSYVNFGSGTTNQLIRYFFRQELAGAKTLVMAGFSGNYIGKTASITVNGNTYTTTVTSNTYNYKGFNGTSIGSVASWVDGTLWEDLAALSSPYTVTVVLTTPSE